MSDYEIVTHPAQPYAAIEVSTSMTRLGQDAPPLHGELYGWLDAHDGRPSGPAFWKYNEVRMPEPLVVEVGTAVAEPVTGDDRVRAGELPAGRYLETLHQGHPDTLEVATGELLAHAESEGLAFDTDGESWAGRIEYYLDDPDEQPDMSQWRTRLSFKLAD